ncbi:hypothetical protein [Lewinella cohaerens]|uniref:hypothetical protein n=1 Tax=Lewinella cohaerens TaxID=70995 RepID=UPI000374D262|nr:hypothetical protein [Lewinella cohaerens]
MSRQFSTWIRFIAVLIMVFVGSIREVAGQVNIQFSEVHTGQITEASVAHIKVMNFTGVEIHYHFKGYVSTPDGQELLRVKSELLKHTPGGADFAEEHQENPPGQLNVDPFKNLTIQFAAPNWESYSGPLNFRAELIHPLDTFSIIARKDHTVRLKNGKFVDEKGRFSTDPSLVKLEVEVPRNQLFELDSLLSFVKLTNNNAYPHCHLPPLVITIKQGRKDIYQLEYQHPCIGIGEQKLKPSDFKVLLDEYASRDRQELIAIHFPNGNHTESAPILTPQHAQYTDTKETFTSSALGLSFDHLEYAKVSPVPYEKGPTLIFDKEGAIVEIAPPAKRSFFYAMPIDYPLGFRVSRDDVNGNFSVKTYDWNSLSEAEWEAFFAGQQKKVIKQQVGDIEVWQSPHLVEVVDDPRTVFPYQRFMLGIRDGNRFLMTSVTKVIVDRTISNYYPVHFSLDEVDFFASLRYHGLGFQPEVDDSGKLLQLIPYAAEPLTPVADRRAVFDRYRAYATLSNLSYSNYYGTPEITEPPSLDSLDRQLEERQKSQLLSLPQITKITPDFDTVRHYATYEWPEIALKMEHRTVVGAQVSPRFSKMFQSFYFDNRDSIVSVSASSGPQNLSEKAGLALVSLESSTLNLSVIPYQHLFVDHFTNSDLTDGQLRGIIAFENSNQASKPADIKKVTLGSWSVFASNRMANPIRRFGTGNMILVKTPSRIYRIRITGGFESDILPFLNSLEIEGQQLKFEYEEEGSVKIQKA